LDLEAATASGLMEAVELYHAEHIVQPLKLASYEEMRYTHSVVDVSAVARSTDSRYHPNLPLLWIEGVDLLGGGGSWVPYELVHTNCSLPSSTGSGCFLPSSNGLASGNHLLEAISHGICEVVERDATSLWQLLDDSARANTRIDLDTVSEPSCRQVIEKFERASLVVAVWETTTDVGIPSFFCLVIEPTDDPMRLLHFARGMGCHPARHIALLRALTEAAQSRLTYISGSRDDLNRAEYGRARSRELLQVFRKLATGDGPIRPFDEGASFCGGTIEEDIAWELDRLRAVDIAQVVVVDLSRAELRLPVARVVIPGLEFSYKPDVARGARARARMVGQA
jgi:YcaO-like protein with predicted kinase domain